MEKKITPGEIVVMAGAGLCLIASFLPFYKFDNPFGGDETRSAWGSGLFPVATLIAIFAVAAGVLVALAKFANVDIKDVLGIGFDQLVLVLTFFAGILALAYLILDKGGLDFSFGYFLLLIGAVGSVVGAVLMMNERKSAGAAPPA